jgi:hypothetical protein
MLTKNENERDNHNNNSSNNDKESYKEHPHSRRHSIQSSHANPSCLHSSMRLYIHGYTFIIIIIDHMSSIVPFHSINQSSQSEHPLIMSIYQHEQQQQIMPIPVVVVAVCGGLVVSGSSHTSIPSQMGT